MTNDLAATPRRALINAVVESLRQITTDTGHHYNLADVVTDEPFRMLDVAEDENGPGDASHAVSVAIASQRRPDDPAKRRTHRLTRFAVCARVRIGIDEFQQALDLLVDDIERAMADQQARYPAGTDFPQYVEMTPVPAKEAVGWAGANIYYDTHIPIR